MVGYESKGNGTADNNANGLEEGQADEKKPPILGKKL